MFEVTVPEGVRPGQPFALIANGQRVMVTCPPNIRPGQKIRFQLPIQLSQQQLEAIKNMRLKQLSKNQFSAIRVPWEEGHIKIK
eukprot:gene10164-13607_t